MNRDERFHALKGAADCAKIGVSCLETAMRFNTLVSGAVSHRVTFVESLRAARSELRAALASIDEVLGADL